MAYDEELAARIRAVLPNDPSIEERKMFGGLAFLLAGRMSCGVVDGRLMVRVPHEAYDEMLSRPHVRPMDFTGKPMRGFVYVEPDGLREESALSAWVQEGLAFAATLPPK